MSTTTEPTPATPALPYPEHDKLGPLGVKTSAVSDPVALRSVLVRAFEAAAHGAREAVGAVDKDAATAVHESRKSLRRARAVLALLGPALPKSERRALTSALKEARRALSSVRDHAVAPETLGQLALDDEDRATATQVLANAAAAMPAISEIRQLLGESAARAAAQAEALQAALPQDVDWETVTRGLRSTYAEARRASRAAKRSKTWFHAWRRRSKELAYQLELIAEQAGPRTAELHAELTAVTDTLSPAVDLIMIREFVTTFDQGVAPEAIARLRTSIGDQLRDAMKSARKVTRGAFRKNAKKLEKRLAKAVRRDLAPIDDHGDDASVTDERKSDLPQ